MTLTVTVDLSVPLIVTNFVVIVALSVLSIILYNANRSTPAAAHSVDSMGEKAVQNEKKTISKPLSNQSLRKHFYRIEEEGRTAKSSEFTRRGMLWSRHASWHLPSAPRGGNIEADSLGGLEQVKATLKRYDVNIRTGFLPANDPLQRLPYARYHLWEDLGDDLPKLLGARLGQARDPLRKLPVLSTDKLTTDAELRRAHLLLCLFAHAFIWGGPEPLDTIPEGIARPLWEVSEKLGIPPVLGHPSIVLYNWRRLDVQAEICMENLATLNNFFTGRDESWFYLITVEVEARGAAAVVPVMLSIDAIQRHHEEKAIADSEAGRFQRSGSHDGLHGNDEDWQRIDSDEDPDAGGFDRWLLTSYDNDNDDGSVFDRALVGPLSTTRVGLFVTKQLEKVAKAIEGMCLSLETMKEGCHPFIFYHRVRPFLSGWRDNPILPNGVIYQGVTEQPQKFFGGSAAQSSLIPFLDIALGISHSNTKSQDFLLAMRAYMIKPHREFLGYLETVACIRKFVTDSLPLADDSQSQSSADRKVWTDLSGAYDSCVKNLQRFRTAHMSLVADYIIAQQKAGAAPGKTLSGSAGGKGTGGTELMKFLKPVRDNCRDSLLGRVASDPVDDEPETTPASTKASEVAAPAADGTSPASIVPSAALVAPSSASSIDNSSTVSTLGSPSVTSVAQNPISSESISEGASVPRGGNSSASDSTSSRVSVGSALRLSTYSPPPHDGVGNEPDSPYRKDNAGREDIDLYRGAAYTQGTIKYYYRPPAILHADSWCSGDVSSHAGVA